jgi:RNA polymerase sigma factor (sigma-70 family)
MATEGEVLSRPFLGEKAWAARARYRRDLAGFSTWLISIARNVATDHLRAQRPHLPLEAADEVAAKSTPHDDVANESDLARLGALLRQLPQREQELVALKYGAHAGGARVEGAQLHGRNGDAEARGAELGAPLKRVFGIEIEQCARRGARLEVIAAGIVETLRT